MKYDSFTLDIIEAGLTAAADEMFAVIKKTAMSPIIYEILDVGTGITDGKGELVSSGAGIPTFVGVLDKAVKAILSKHPSPCEGDIYVTNDPYYGGVTHLNDVVICQPVFANNKLMAWVASIAHWSDIGGMTPGSMSIHATEIFQEGLRLPAVKIFDQGKIVDGLLDIIVVNSRMPDFAKGDLWAQVAAGKKAETRIKSIVKNYGSEAFDAAIDRAFSQAEARVRSGLLQLPKGKFAMSQEQDSGAIWSVEVENTDEEFVVDLSDAPTQTDGPFNTSLDGATISAQMVLKAICDPTLTANSGSYRALRVITKEGTQFHAKEPAAHAYYFETRIALFDLIWKCLAPHMPERLPAGHFASICGTVFAGKNPYTGRRFTMVEPQQGGWGATHESEGQSAMYSTSHGETFNCPVEICEARYGIEVVEKGLSVAPENQKELKGGRGVKTVYRAHGDMVMSTGFSHSKVPAWGMDDKTHGGTNTVNVSRSNGDFESASMTSDCKILAGETVTIDTAFGGGR